MHQNQSISNPPPFQLNLFGWCDDYTYEVFKSLASKPLKDLMFSDLLMLTSHDKCCGDRLRKEVSRSLSDNRSSLTLSKGD